MGAIQASLTEQKLTIAPKMSAATKQLVIDTIQSNKVVIFSKRYCPYSTMAKEQFQKLSVPFFVLELDTRNDGKEIQDILGSMTGSKTVPRCFIDGKFVGGGTDIKKLFEEGELQKFFA